MTDPAIAQMPFGAEVDGRRLLGEAVGFATGPAGGAALDRHRRVRGLRACADAGGHRRPGAGPWRRRRDLRPSPRRSGDVRQGVRALVAPAWIARRGGLPGAATASPGRRRTTCEPDPPAAKEPEPGEESQSARPEERGIPIPAEGEDADDEESPDRGGRGRPGCLFAGRGPAPPRVRPDDAGRTARGGASRGQADPAAGAPPDAPVRAALARPPAGAAGHVPAQPGHRRAADGLGLAPADPRAALAGRPLRHLGVHGAPLAAAPAVRPGVVGGVRGPDGVLRVRDTADAGHAAAARPRSRPGPRARVRVGQRLGRRDPHRRVVPDVQPAVGPALPADVRRRHRGVGWLGPRRSRARRHRDRPTATQLPSPGLAEPARRHARLSATGRRDARRLSVHRRLPAGRDGRQPGAPRRDPGRCPGGRHASRQ